MANSNLKRDKRIEIWRGNWNAMYGARPEPTRREDGSLVMSPSVPMNNPDGTPMTRKQRRKVWRESRKLARS